MERLFSSFTFKSFDMKHEYLIELLKVNKTVIIPNIGAISNNENPHHPFLFNEYLKFNDGILAKHISSKENISMDAAGGVIDKFTNELKEILGAGKEVVIPGVGTLVKKDGKTILNSPFANVTPEKKEIQKAEVPKAEKPKAETPKVEIPKVETPKIVIPKAETPKVEVPKAEPPKPESPKVIIPEIVVPKAEIPKTEAPKTEIPKVEMPIAEVPKIETPKAEVIETKKENKKQPKEKKEKKKSRKLVWIILLILILGGGGTAGYIFREEIMKMAGMGEETSENKKGKNEESKNENKKENNADAVTNEATEDTIANSTNEEQEVMEEDSAPAEEKVVEEPIKEEPIKVVAENSSPGNYYIIVGCFQEQAHADNMIGKISAAGLTPTNVGTFSGLQHIAAGSASDLSSALQQATSIRGSFPKLWILNR